MRRASVAITVGLLLGILSWPWCLATASAEASVPHWRAHAVIVESHAPRWNVARAARQWSKARGLRIVVAPCRASRPCVEVRDGGRNKSGVDGATTLYVGPRGHRLAGAVVRLYNYAHLTPGERAELAMHELGHAIGLWHVSSRASVMYPYTHSQWHPSAADYRRVERIYG